MMARFFNQSVRFGGIGALTERRIVCVRFKNFGIASGLGESMEVVRAVWV